MIVFEQLHCGSKKIRCNTTLVPTSKQYSVMSAAANILVALLVLFLLFIIIYCIIMLCVLCCVAMAEAGRPPPPHPPPHPYHPPPEIMRDHHYYGQYYQYWVLSLMLGILLLNQENFIGVPIDKISGSFIAGHTECMWNYVSSSPNIVYWHSWCRVWHKW